MVLKSTLTKQIYKPGEIAKMIGVSLKTIQNYCDKGIIKNKFTPYGQRIIELEEVINFLEKNNAIYNDDDKIDIIYTRVSTQKQKKNRDLDRQKEKIISNIITKNPRNLQIFEEVGSGLNDNRKELNKILDLVLENKVNRIFILYKDRLTRFGFNYLKKFFDKHNVKIEIILEDIKDKSVEEELAEDIISIIHSFSGKLYGMRNKLKVEIEKIKEN